MLTWYRHRLTTVNMSRPCQNNASVSIPCRRGGLSFLAFLTLCMLVAPQAHADGQILRPVQLTTMSQQLINEIKSGTADATEFRTNVVFYRESLRGFMLANEKDKVHQIDDHSLLQLVRMAALLQSAAECRTGRYISCPANLMHELERQQYQLSQVFPGDAGTR